MTTPHTWTFDDSRITTVVSEPGQVTLTWDDGSAFTYFSRSFLGLIVLTLIASVREEVLVAIRNAIWLAWPEPVPPPGAVVVSNSFTITPDPK